MQSEFLDKGHWSRRFLPHYDQSGIYQMITYRLQDSLPKEVLQRLNPGSSGGSPESTHNADYRKNFISGSSGGSPDSTHNADHRKKIEAYLDAGYGSCLLANPLYAKIVVDNRKFFHTQRYDLIAYVIMPNHIHILIRTYEAWSLHKVIHSWKSYSSHEILKLKNNSNHSPRVAQTPNKNIIWQREYWDRFIRDEKHFLNAVEYIHMNPVKAGLAQSPDKWQWSSFND